MPSSITFSPIFPALSLLLACAAFAPAQQQRQPEEILKQAIAQHQAGNVEAAIPAYQQYLALSPDSPMVLSNLGAAYSRTGRYADAIVQYQKALKLQPSNNAGLLLNLGLAYYKTSQTELAAASFEKVHRAAPAELQPILLLADCWLAMGRNKDVVDLLSPIQRERPDDLAVAYQLGTALVRDKQVERGQVVIDRILRNGDSAEARLLMGTIRYNSQDYPAALADFSKAIELNPKMPGVYSWLGQALQGAGDPAAATDAFRKAIAADPGDYTANLQLAGLLKDEQSFDEALALLRRALQVRPRDIAARYQIAAIDFQQGRTDPARIELERIVKETPAFTSAHVTLATVYYRLKRREDGDRERAIVQKLNAETQAKQQQGINVK